MNPESEISLNVQSEKSQRQRPIRSAHLTDRRHRSAGGVHAMVAALLLGISCMLGPIAGFSATVVSSFPEVTLGDGSIAQEVDLQITNNPAAITTIKGYIRRPGGAVPVGGFPLVVVMHGGGTEPAGTVSIGRQMTPPILDFIVEDWAVLTLDYRIQASRGVDPFPQEWEDTIEGIEWAKTLIYINPRSVAMNGGSHGGFTTAHVMSRMKLNAAVIAAPAQLNYVETWAGYLAGECTSDKSIAAIEQAVISVYGAPSVDAFMADPAAYGYTTAYDDVQSVKTPAVFLIRGQNDCQATKREVEGYEAALIGAGITVGHYYPERGDHGFYHSDPYLDPESQTAADLQIAFMRPYMQRRRGGGFARGSIF